MPPKQTSSYGGLLGKRSRGACREGAERAWPRPPWLQPRALPGMVVALCRPVSLAALAVHLNRFPDTAERVLLALESRRISFFFPLVKYT